MSSTTLKVVTVVLVLLAFVLAGVSYYVFHGYAEDAQKAADNAKKESTPQVLAVVAVKPLAAYKPIDRDSVALVPVTVAPTQYYSNLDDVVGHQPLVDIDAGAPVTARYFKEGNALARVIPVGYQALSIEVSDVIAVGDFVRPGDIVDVLLYLRNDTNDQTVTQARVLLKDVRVLAYEDRIIDRPEGVKDDPSAANRQQVRHQRTAVLAVPEADVTRVMLGVSKGEIRLALHGQAPAQAEAEPLGENGLPLTPKAQKALDAHKVPDKAITAVELARVKPAASDKAKAPRPTVEVIRGTKNERVTTN